MSDHERETETSRGDKGFFASLSPKSSFTVGLVGGIMFLCTIGFFVLLTVYIQGGMDDNSNSGSAVAGVETKGNANANVAPTPTPSPTPTNVDIEIVDGDYILGNPNAEITLVEYSDIECPYCSSFHESAKQLVETYPDDVRWIYRHFPLDSLHPDARPAAEASECAAEQKGNDGFWTYLDALFANQSKLGDAYFKELAGDQGLDVAAFTDCYDNGKYADKVDADYEGGLEYGVRGTPGSYLNGTELGGAVPFAQLDAAVKSLLGK